MSYKVIIMANRFNVLYINDSDDSDNDDTCDTLEVNKTSNMISNMISNISQDISSIPEVKKKYVLDKMPVLEEVKARFVVDDVIKMADKIEDVFSIKKNNNIHEQHIDKVHAVVDEKENPEFVWIKQYTKVYNVNDPATTFPIFSNSKYTYNKKRTPKGNSMPLVAPSDIGNFSHAEHGLI